MHVNMYVRIYFDDSFNRQTTTNEQINRNAQNIRGYMGLQRDTVGYSGRQHNTTVHNTIENVQLMEDCLVVLKGNIQCNLGVFFITS